MNIEYIIPYKNNARHNEKAIPAVAESIRRFGFKGAIVLESRDNPVIVNGHTRVAACKSLGWTEFPDENIVYADDLSKEEIKALRLADNKTGEIATWNTALLKKEMKSLKNLKMDAFGFKMPKAKPYGAERLRTDDYYNLEMCNSSYCTGKWDMPLLEPCNLIPKNVKGFNYALTTPDEEAKDTWLHFFIDDYQFERLWNSPEKYLDTLRRFKGVLSPDFSLYMDMPRPMQMWNEYRRRALMNYWQRNGLNVIPTLSWTNQKSYDFCFNGIPKRSTVAVSTVGIMRDKTSNQIFKDGLSAALKKIKPKTIIMYGISNFEFDFGQTNPVFISARQFS